MKHIHVGEKLSEECKKDIEFSLEYLRSRQCQNYQTYRDHGGPRSSELPSSEAMSHLKKSAQGGHEILRKHGGEMLRQLSIHRERYK